MSRPASVLGTLVVSSLLLLGAASPAAAASNYAAPDYLAHGDS